MLVLYVEVNIRDLGVVELGGNVYLAKIKEAKKLEQEGCRNEKS